MIRLEENDFLFGTKEVDKFGDIIFIRFRKLYVTELRIL